MTFLRMDKYSTDDVRRYSGILEARLCSSDALEKPLSLIWPELRTPNIFCPRCADDLGAASSAAACALVGLASAGDVRRGPDVAAGTDGESSGERAGSRLLMPHV